MSGWPIQLSRYRVLCEETKRLFEIYRDFLRQRDDYPGDITSDSSDADKDSYSIFIAFVVPKSQEEFEASNNWFEAYSEMINEMEVLLMETPKYPFPV